MPLENKIDFFKKSVKLRHNYRIFTKISAMSFHLAHIHDYERFLVIDMGTYRVRAGVYKVEKQQLKEIGYATVRQNRKNFSGGQISDMQGVAATIEQAILQASKDLDHIPEDIIISFPSSDFLFDSITTQYTRADPSSTLTMQELDTMIKKIESQSYARAREKARIRSGVFQDDLRLISSTITSVAIDGKKITNPVGFSGGKVMLTVLNVFAPASEFNIVRSIIASLGRKMISLIPMPLIFPKVVEQTEYINERACYLDIGYSHTTVLVMQDNEIKTFETFPVGARMSMEMLRDEHKTSSLLGIENILVSESEIREPKNQEILNDFFEYILDMVWAFLEQEKLNVHFTNLFLHGNIFENPTIFKIFGTAFEENCGYSVRKKRLSSLVNPEYRHDESITYGLALTASELLVVKKDPLIRILRYVLYSYE